MPRKPKITEDDVREWCRKHGYAIIQKTGVRVVSLYAEVFNTPTIGKYVVMLDQRGLADAIAEDDG